MAEQWIDWHPKVGDIKPARYQVRYKQDAYDPWEIGREPGMSVTRQNISDFDYQIPAPVVTPPEDRPPWIDPQCKFRWGDRVKVTTDSRVGHVAYVINPHDTSDAGYGVIDGYTVLVGTSLSAAVPYETAGNLHKHRKWNANYALDRLREDHLEPFPEELPQHFDDRLLDADQPQEQPRTTRVPREIWVNVYPRTPLRHGGTHDTQDEANLHASSDRVECVHFREVL